MTNPAIHTPSRLLHVIGSPRPGSKSRAVAQAYIDERLRLQPGLVVHEVDVWNVKLPEITHDTLSAKYAVLARATHDDAQRTAWDAVVREAKAFADHDEYVFSVPMWNFGIPYRLKHYIDVVTQPGLTFTWTPEHGYQGLLHRRRALVAYASSFDYAGGSPLAPLDLQKQYVLGWLKLVGITEVNSIDAGPTSAAIPASAPAQTRAAELATQLAQAVSAYR